MEEKVKEIEENEVVQDVMEQGGNSGNNQGVIVNSQGVFGNKYRLIVVTVCVLLAVAGILLVALL